MTAPSTTTSSVVSEHDSLFRFWLTQGWRYRRRQSVELQQNPRLYKDRMQMEYKIIREIPGYTDYFLMVSDIVRFAKDSGIVVGPGRGSGASSLVCWLLRITEIDPLLFPMLFERFISVDRTDLPDIDIDFEDERRWEVIEYAQEKYGYDRVANILNFVRYKGRNSLDDIARVYHVPSWKIENIKSKLVDRAEGHPRFAKTLEDTIDSVDTVQQYVHENPEIQLATKLEGNYRNSSIHPAGIVIASVPLHQVTATYTKESGEEHGSGIAYDKKDAEYLGLLKIDFLSLTTLSGIAATLDAIGMTINELYQVPLDDPLVYQGFREGNVLGIFQFEGMATRRVLRDVEPQQFMDLSHVNALSRPGGDNEAFVRNKTEIAAGSDLIARQHPILQQHLGWTFGVIVYQEQILSLLRDLGDFPSADTNMVRHIISQKLDTTVLNQYRERFIAGAESHEIDRDYANRIWSVMLTATGYAFNISHSVSYSLIAYWQMWLKVHHKEFYLGQLMKCPDTEEGKVRRGKLIREAEQRGIKVNPPSLDVSQSNWALVGNELFAGFTAVKGIGPALATAIVDWRDERLRAPLRMNLDFEEAHRFEWEQLQEIAGIGPGRIEIIRDFCESPDPFNVRQVQRHLEAVRNMVAGVSGVPYPTHRSEQLNRPDEHVVFVGLLKDKILKNRVDQAEKYRGETREEALETLPYPDLLDYMQLVCVDENRDDPVRIRVEYRTYPKYREYLDNAKKNKCAVLVDGLTCYWYPKGGDNNEIGIVVNRLWIIELD